MTSANFDTPVLTADHLATVLPPAPKKPASRSRPKLPLLPPKEPEPEVKESQTTQENGDEGLGSPVRQLYTSRGRKQAAAKRSKAPAPTKKRKTVTPPPTPEGFEVENLEDTVTDEEDEEEAAPTTPPSRTNHAVRAKKARTEDRGVWPNLVTLPSSSRATSMVAHAVPVADEDKQFVGVGYGKLNQWCTAVTHDQIFGEKFQRLVESYAENGHQMQLVYTCTDLKERPVPGMEGKRKLVQFIMSAADAHVELRCLKLIKDNELKWTVTPFTADKKKLRFYVTRVIAQKLLD